MADVQAAVAATLATFSHVGYAPHIVAEETGRRDENAAGAVPTSARRFLVKFSRPSAAEPVPRFAADVHLTVSEAAPGDAAKWSYAVESEATVRSVGAKGAGLEERYLTRAIEMKRTAASS